MFVSVRSILGSIAVVLLVLLWVFYVYVLQNDLFYYYYWLDIPMHIIGGLILSLFISLIVVRKDTSHKELQFTIKNFFWIIYWSVLIGILWEYFEHFFKLRELTNNTLVDTLTDIGNDLLGAILGIVIIILVIKLDQRKHDSFSRTIQ